MACPYFYPVARLEEELWAIPPRLPLVDAYTGECRILAARATPEGGLMRGACNSGYARGRCDRFPADASFDAVRFSVISDSDQQVCLKYVFEKDCWPLEHGELQYSTATQTFTGPVLNETGTRQAHAFVESYLRRAR